MMVNGIRHVHQLIAYKTKKDVAIHFIIMVISFEQNAISNIAYKKSSLSSKPNTNEAEEAETECNRRSNTVI